MTELRWLRHWRKAKMTPDLSWLAIFFGMAMICIGAVCLDSSRAKSGELKSFWSPLPSGSVYYTIAIHNSAGFVVGVKPDGKVVLGKGIALDEASKTFWQEVGGLAKESCKQDRQDKAP